MNKMNIRAILYYIGGSLLVVGAAFPVFPGLEPYAPMVYTIGALLFAAVQISASKEQTDVVIKRLRRQQVLSCGILVVAGIMMFMKKYHISPCTGDEWKLALAIGAFMQLYTSLRMPKQEDLQD